MATFAELFKQFEGKPFKAKNKADAEAHFDGAEFRWNDEPDTKDTVNAYQLISNDWQLIPPEPTVEQILADGEFRLSDTPGYDGIVQIRPVDKFKGPIWPCLYVEAVKLTTAEAARELVAFLSKYR